MPANAIAPVELTAMSTKNDEFGLAPPVSSLRRGAVERLQPERHALGVVAADDERLAVGHPERARDAAIDRLRQVPPLHRRPAGATVGAVVQERNLIARRRELRDACRSD